MTPQEYCKEMAGGKGSSFYYSSLFLEHAQREALTAVYAFREEIREITRAPADPQLAQVKLAWWREEIANTFANRPNHPIGKALRGVVQAYALPRERFLDILAGAEYDLARTHFATLDELRSYCRQITSATTLLSIPILGGETSGTEDLLCDLGVALHLTEILRDAGEDARRNRIYLPMEDLARFKVKIHDILQARETENFYALMEFHTRQVYASIEQALESLPQPDRWRQLPHVIMAQIYLALLEELRSDGHRVLQHKVALTPLRKGWIAWRTRRREKRGYKDARTVQRA